jgi:hypothetical protein
MITVSRTLGLLFIVESVLNLMIGCPTREGCAGLSQSPLPGPRALWDWESQEAWASRYNRYISTTNDSERVLTLYDLIVSKQANMENDRSTNSSAINASVEQLARWCEDTDEFGTLIWMASSLLSE